ncbi:cysteine synthase-like [Paramacrobiotus metropolitanus]|uniref:cysteine synthase-like n=1 Tax=Paramacrobiotus metropolitanus TaxID=2943436 RepID=UPI0024456586|nr:cysteine synthase-like [Paramacrobiotus metropolitanus]
MIAENALEDPKFQPKGTILVSERPLVVAQSITDLVGGTPALRLHCMFPNHYVIAKLEFLNPLLSVKDRPALQKVKNIASKNLLSPGGLIIVPTSGNFGLSVATYGRLFGYRVIAVMASDTSSAKQDLLRRVCGEVVIYTCLRLINDLYRAYHRNERCNAAK